MTEVQSVVGLGAFLPCNIRPMDTGMKSPLKKKWNIVKSFTNWYRLPPSYMSYGPMDAGYVENLD